MSPPNKTPAPLSSWVGAEADQGGRRKKCLDLARRTEPLGLPNVCTQAGGDASQTEDIDMGFGRGVLLWLIGVPIPIIILIAVLWHH
jgi:hypothetical protein